MKTLEMKEKNFMQFLERVQSQSKLEQMLVLMLEDEKVGSISVKSNQLYKTAPNRAEAVAVPYWELNTDELKEFFALLKQVLRTEVKEDISDRFSFKLTFEDSTVLISYSADSDDILINCRKANAEASMADLIRNALQMRPTRIVRPPAEETNGRIPMAGLLAGHIAHTQPRQVTIESPNIISYEFRRSSAPIQPL